MIRFLFHIFLNIVLSVRFIPFKFNLSLLRKKHRVFNFVPLVEMILLFLLMNEPIDSSVVLLIFNKEIFQPNTIECCLPLTSHVSCATILLIKVMLFSCLSLCFCHLSRSWLIFISIILSNDVETNPGDFVNSFFTFCNWNLNSLAKDDFYRVKLLEAHNSIFNYDIISICETSLNDTVDLPDIMLENYSFVSCNNPCNTRRGGVGLFYKNDLPIKIRNDLSFDESIVVELVFGREKIFFTVLYKSPSDSHGTPQFETFLNNFETLYENIKNETPFAVFFARDYNGHSRLW